MIGTKKKGKVYVAPVIFLVCLLLGFTFSPSSDLYNLIFAPVAGVAIAFLLFAGAPLKLLMVAVCANLAIQLTSRLWVLMATPSNQWGYYLIFGVLAGACITVVLALVILLFNKLPRS